MDDYKFNVMWNDPEPRIEKLRQYKAVLSPNFSIYTEMPLSLKVYNTFKNRWCGAYLQSKGIKVIPTLAWGEPNTYWFCFDGIAKGSTVAVSTLGVRTEKTLFMQGYDEMLRKIKPEKVICYGKPFEEMKGKIIEIDYAETNNFRKNFVMRDFEERGRDFPSIINGMQITKTRENFIKGMGSASGGRGNTSGKPENSSENNPTGDKKIKLPKNDSQIKHIFRNDEGHLPDTPENRQLLEDVANKKENYAGTDARGNQWYSKMQPDGSQVWVESRNDTIQNGGLNNPPRNWHPETGYNIPKKGFDFMKIVNYTDRGFYSLFYLLENKFDIKETDSLACLLSDMDPNIWLDSKSADPAAYLDYEDCLKVCLESSKKEDVKTAFAASMKYLEFYRDEFGFEIDDVIKSLSIEEYEKYFNKLKEN